jgi:hypothetical protein
MSVEYIRGIYYRNGGIQDADYLKYEEIIQRCARAAERGLTEIVLDTWIYTEIVDMLKQNGFAVERDCIIPNSTWCNCNHGCAKCLPYSVTKVRFIS